MDGFIIGEKSNQSQTFNSKGDRIPTTFIQTSPCHLIQLKTTGSNGYMAVQIGFKQTKNCKKPVEGTIKKAGIKNPLRFLSEFRLAEKNSKLKITEEAGKTSLMIGDKRFEIGSEIKPADMFAVGEFVDVSGISKGKGFQGVVKRHAFKGGPKTHGQSDRERAPGAIGMTTTPGRVYKGKRMAGRMGGERVTVKKLEVVAVQDDGLIVKGLVPGPLGGFVEVKRKSK